MLVLHPGVNSIVMVVVIVIIIVTKVQSVVTIA
jgi:hypothetical protein